MRQRVELSTRTLAWTFIAASEVVAYILTMSTEVLPVVRYVCGWYTLIVGFLLFAVLAVTLSVLFGEHGRLNTSQGWLLRTFYFF